MVRFDRAALRVWILLLLFVAAQTWFTFGARNLREGIVAMPPAPTMWSLKAISLGDDEFIFRYLARWLQYVGDGGGRIRPLRDYDYDRIVDWMETLDQLDDLHSDYVHELAARYFGQITPTADPGGERLRKIVRYLRASSLRDPARFWKWLVWCADKARKPLHDAELTKTLARDLQSPEMRAPSVPAWVRLLPVQLYQAVGDPAAARDALAKVSPEDLKEVERMREEMTQHLRAFKQRVPTPPPAANGP